MDEKQILIEIHIAQVQAESLATAKPRGVEQSEECEVRPGPKRIDRWQLPCGMKHGLRLTLRIDVRNVGRSPKKQFLGDKALGSN